MPQGVVKSYNSDRGFGFIRNGSSEDSDIFFHITEFSVDKEGRPPRKGDRVEFVAEVGNKGLAASDLKRIDG